MPNVKGGSVGVGLKKRGEVLVPMTTYESSEARSIRVPDIVIAGPPGVRVWPSMM